MNSDQPYNYDLRQFQLRSVVLLDAIDKVCKEHGIKYYVIAGTLLGALRHKGFIPWDDDLDVALMRSDYDKLLERYEVTTDTELWEKVRLGFVTINHD